MNVADKAVLNYLETVHGVDISAVRRHLRGMAVSGARLRAMAVKIEGVRLVLREQPVGRDGIPNVLLSAVHEGRPGTNAE